MSLYVGNQPDNPDDEGDSPSDYYKLAGYTYNENSQVATHGLSIDQYVSTYSYNSRNWVSVLTKQGGNPVFAYALAYNLNGNIRRQSVGGSYLQNLSEQSPLQITYIYDQSNRLVKADKDSASVSTSFDLINNYDKDGNFVSLKRYGSSNNLVDAFNYQYFSGTNRLQKLSGGITDDYTYDNNGNVITDQLNHNSQMKYDYRNLLIENLNTSSQFTYKTKYYYDEAGNRVRKLQYLYVNGTPPGGGTGMGGDSIIVDEGDASGYWSMVGNTFYVRDISGKEIAVYSGSSLQQWNLWGLDQVGHMNSDTTKYYYLKDHLGSTRAVINSTNTVVSAQDYDAWGYLMENRSYQSENSKYKFTGKERDKDLENNYDYFGARYYDSRIGRWGQTEPMLNKYTDISPYNYALNNPLVLFDPTGRDAIFIHYINYRIGVSGKSIPGIGHAGILLIDNKSGEVKYYDFGRYGKDDKGIVRSNTSLGFKLDNIPVGSDGKLDQNAISERLKTISNEVGKGSEIQGAYIESEKYTEMVDYANSKFEQTNSSDSEDEYDKITNNCATFASDVMKQDPNVNGAPTPFVFMPVQISAWYQTLYPSVNYNKNQESYQIGNGAKSANKNK